MPWPVPAVKRAGFVSDLLVAVCMGGIPWGTRSRRQTSGGSAHFPSIGSSYLPRRRPDYTWLDGAELAGLDAPFAFEEQGGETVSPLFASLFALTGCGKAATRQQSGSRARRATKDQSTSWQFPFFWIRRNRTLLEDELDRMISRLTGEIMSKIHRLARCQPAADHASQQAQQQRSNRRQGTYARRLWECLHATVAHCGCIRPVAP